MAIDWEEQWALFAPGYRDGFAHVNLKGGKTLRLKAGPGFGDLSHSTTRLVLNFLEEILVPKAAVLDIGCGSGILTLAASLLGAKACCGIDISPEALVHAKENKRVNSLENVYFDALPPKRFSPDFILMNMILSEQKQVWDYSFKDVTLITSGILATQREEYLTLTTSWGFQLLEEKQEGDWLAFLLRNF